MLRAMEDLPTPSREMPSGTLLAPVKAKPAVPSLPPPPPPPAAPPTTVFEPASPTPPPPPPTVSYGRGARAPAEGGLARMRRILTRLAILLIVVLIGFLGFLLLRKTVFPPHKEVTLTYWGLWEDSDIINPLLTDFVSAYTAEHPNISLTINYEKRTFGTLEQYKETLLTRLKQETAPDIFRLHNSWVKEFVGELTSLPTEMMSETDYTAAFYPAALSSAKVGEAIYAIPLEYDGIVLYYNKDLLKGVDVASALATWESFRREAVKLTQWEENDPQKKILRAGAAFGAANNISHSSDLLSLLFSQSGVDPLTELETQAAADALAYYTKFVKIDHIWDETLPFSINAFANGQVAMTFGPSWRALDIHNLNPRLNFAAVSVPQLPAAQEKGIHWASFWMEAVNKDSENAGVAWQLLKFLTEEEQQKRFYSAASQVRYFGEPYSRPSLAENLATHEILRPLLVSASGAVSSKTVDFSGDKAYVDAFKQAIADVLAGKEASQALKTAQATINQLEGVTPEE